MTYGDQFNLVRNKINCYISKPFTVLTVRSPQVLPQNSVEGDFNSSLRTFGATVAPKSLENVFLLVSQKVKKKTKNNPPLLVYCQLISFLSTVNM